MSKFSINPNETAVLLLDPQDGLLELSRTVDAVRLRTAAVRLVQLARLSGLLTEVAVQHSVLSAAENGYNAQLVVDACGGLSPRTEEAALRRLVQSGVAITSCASVA